ncbi:MAG: GGDEF and EAL domain-containing protein, partial [Alphaproteobacteria bacterium]|nr:GGDEF and EAL domain-containing protein [Alphaproteobacteria bacterium]
SAAIFAIVVAVGAATVFGAFAQNFLAPSIVGGFTAAGSVLLALAIAAGEVVAVLPLARGAAANKVPEAGASAVLLQAISGARQGLFELEFATDRVQLSYEGASILGLTAARAFSRDEWIARIHPDDRQIYLDAFREYQTHPGLSFRMEVRIRHESGTYRWLELRATIFAGPLRTRCLGLVADVTARKESEVEAPHRLLRDPLTGLGNRVALLEELEQVGDAWPRIAFAVVDIDRFKAIHSSLGDEGGDRLLVNFASRIGQQFASDVRVFRIGGDSFGVVVPTGSDHAARLGAELGDVCSTPFSVNNRNVFASASIGIALGSDAEDSLELIRRAEIALSFAKRQGGGCWKLFVPNMEALVREDAVALETDLRRGLGETEFTLHHQPIVRLSDGSVAGFEALLRWQHPTKGLVSPAEFIAHSEETGLIVALGRFALERAASDLADWHRYFPISPPLFASVNVSRRQLQDASFAVSIEKLLAAGNFGEGTFCLELTESAFDVDSDARSILERLRALGAGLAIDDFGTGLSNLSQIKDLPFDTIKIDRSFLARRTAPQEDADAAAVMNSILTLARELRRTVVVEGVETERDAIWLRQLGCELAQGYYFSPPLAPDDTLKFIASHFRMDASSRGTKTDNPTGLSTPSMG